MYTCDNVQNALDDLEKRNPKVLNIPFEDNTLGKEQMTDEEASYEIDKKRYKTDVMSRDCYLRSKQESQNLRNILKRKCRNYKYVKAAITDGLYFYESKLISTYEFLHNVDNFKNYTSVHLKHDILMFVMKNFDNIQLLSEIMMDAIAEPKEQQVSMKAWIMYYLKSEQWGDCSTLLHIVAYMWGLNFSFVNFNGHTDSLLLCFGNHTDSKEADAYFIYNSFTHYTGTGDCHFFYFDFLFAMLIF